MIGAGKIGRSFIGQLFSRGGYEVVFIDVYKPVIDELNRRGVYKVIIKADADSVIEVENVRGVFAGHTDLASKEIASASIVAVSVGTAHLKSIVPLIAKGLIDRFESPDSAPLDIIIAENLRNAAEYLGDELKKCLPLNFQFQERVGLIETSIGKMVPIIQQKDVEFDILQVFAEPYNTLILDKMAFKNPIPELEGLAPKENMKAWVDRKLFIHNLGHSTAAYLGYLAFPTATYMYEVLSDEQLNTKVRNTMLQAAQVLLKMYPDEFTLETLTYHIDDLLYRFRNKALGDTIFRVGCDLQRKLSAEDRLAGAIHLARKYKLPFNLILESLVSACHFKATNEEGNILTQDLDFFRIYESGFENVLTLISGFCHDSDKDLIKTALSIENSIVKQ